MMSGDVCPEGGRRSTWPGRGKLWRFETFVDLAQEISRYAQTTRAERTTEVHEEHLQTRQPILGGRRISDDCPLPWLLSMAVFTAGHGRPRPRSRENDYAQPWSEQKRCFSAFGNMNRAPGCCQATIWDQPGQSYQGSDQGCEASMPSLQACQCARPCQQLLYTIHSTEYIASGLLTCPCLSRRTSFVHGM